MTTRPGGTAAKIFQPTREYGTQTGDSLEGGFWSNVTGLTSTLGQVAADATVNAGRIAFAIRNWGNPNLYGAPDTVHVDDGERIRQAREGTGTDGGLLDGETAGIPNSILIIGAAALLVGLALKE